VALAKLKVTGVGDVLASPGCSVSFTPVAFPSPVVLYAVSAKDRGDEDKIGLAVARVAEDDPTSGRAPRGHARDVIGGMGDVHLDVALEFMKKRSNVAIALNTPKVSYKETVTAVGEGHYRHRSRPAAAASMRGLLPRAAAARGRAWFEDAVVGGVIPRNFIPACEKGFVEAMKAGVQAGFRW